MNEFIFTLQRFAISNYKKNRLISGTSSADTIRNYAGGAMIRGQGGNDFIFSNTNSNYTINGGYGYVTLDGGNGNDSIFSYDPNVSISGGAGKDLISLRGSDFDGVTINAGKGNDTIFGDSLGGGVLYQYATGDGNDLIYNFTARDSVTISGADSWTSVKSGSNVILKIGSGKITLVGAKGKSLNIYPNKKTSNAMPAVTQQEVVKKFMQALDTTENSGMSALNQAVRAASGGYFLNANAVIARMVADCQSSKNATAFLKNFCGINLSNNDTGAITGSDAGGSSVKTAQSIVPENGELNSFTDSSFTVNGLTFQLASLDGGNNVTLLNYDDLADDKQKYIWQALETWWAKSALDLIAQSYGENYSFESGATAKKIYIAFSSGSNSMAATGGWFTDSTRKTVNRMVLVINMDKFNSLIIGDEDGKVSDRNTFYLDRVLAHELTHAAMYSHINYSDDLPRFIKEGMAELTHGADDDRKSEITSLAKNPSKLSNSLLFDSYYSYAAGYIFLRYLAKQSSEHYPLAGTVKEVVALQNKTADSGDYSKTISVKNSLLTVKKTFPSDMIDLADYSSDVKTVDATAQGKGVMIIGNTNANSIAAGAGSDTIFGNTGKDTISGGAGNDLLYGDASNDIIDGGTGNDTLYGGTGNDILTGDNGKDIFVFGTSGGNDTITDYTPAKDKILLVGASIISSSFSNSDLILNLGQNGAIKIKNGKDKKITVIDRDGNETTKKYPNTLLVTDSTKSPVTVDSSVEVIDASTRTTAVKITANKLANSIFGGKGNDTLAGGKGNDSLWGNGGADTFIYSSGDGKDVIFDFEGDDFLQINGTFSATYNTAKKEIYFKVDSTSKAITLKNFSATTFNVNGANYKISGKNLVRD